MYDGEGEVAWPKHLHKLISMIYEEDEFTDEQVRSLISYTLHESPFCWVLNLPADTVHSCDHFCDLIEEMFYHFDPYYLYEKLLQQWRAPHEFVIYF